MIEKLFQIHVRKVQLLTYFSKVLHFEAQKFDKKVRHLSQTNSLILDKNINDSEQTILNLIEEKQSSYEYKLACSTPINFHNLALIFENKRLYEIVSKLRSQQKEILYLLYIEGLTEIEVAKKLAITKQAVNKTKNQTLKKIKQNYEQGVIKCQFQN